MKEVEVELVLMLFWGGFGVGSAFANAATHFEKGDSRIGSMRKKKKKGVSG